MTPRVGYCHQPELEQKKGELPENDFHKSSLNCIDCFFFMNYISQYSNRFILNKKQAKVRELTQNFE